MLVNSLSDHLFGAGVSVRKEPIQHRSSIRISTLVDAAARVVHEVGVERMTTALVAEEAGASIGTVYRYFPDRIALLGALSVRNSERFLRGVKEDVLHNPPATWIDLVMIAFEVELHLHRTEIGYTSVRLSDLVAYPHSETREIRSVRFAEIFAVIIAKECGFEPTSDHQLCLEMALTMIDSFLLRAFLSDENGDESVINEARMIVSRYLRSYPL